MALARSPRLWLSFVLVAALAAGVLSVAGAPADAGTRRFVGGWIPYWATSAGTASFAANADLFSDLSPFWHELESDTAVSDQASPGDRALVIAAARAAGVPVVPTVSDGTPTGALAAALAIPSRRSTVVNTLVALVKTRGYDGLDLNFEGFAYHDPKSTWPTTRPNWVAFVAELAQVLHDRGKVLYATIPPTYDSNRSSTSGYWVYDYAGMAPHADRVRIMAYDYSVSSPGPIAPYDWVRSIVTYAVTQIPANKVVLGIPAYGRDWVTAITGTCPDGTSVARRSLTAAEAWDVAADKGATVRWDAAARERTFTYAQRYFDATTSCTVARVVWFVDGTAASERARLYYTFSIRGVALWTIGGADATTWQALDTLADGRGYPLTAGQVLEVPVAGGSTGVPADAEAVNLNVTVTAPRAPGFVSVYPCGNDWPGTSNLNFAAGQTVANNVLVGVGSGGKVCLYTSTTTHVVVDASGYFPAGSPYDPRTPVRLKDTRTGTKPTAGSDIAVVVPSGIGAAGLSIAVTEPDRPGWVSAYPCGTAWPGTSTVNFAAGQTIAASAITKPGLSGTVCFRTSVSTHLVVDLMGTFGSDAGFTALTPSRILDSRTSPGTRIPAFTEFAVDSDVTGGAAGLNVTVTGPVGNGWLQVYPCGIVPPATSTVNFVTGQTVANAAIVEVGPDRTVCLRSMVATHVVLDRTGAFGDDGGYYVPQTPSRLEDTRTL